MKDPSNRKTQGASPVSALVKRKVPEKVFATVEEAARWLAPLAGEEADALARAAAAVIEVR